MNIIARKTGIISSIGILLFTLIFVILVFVFPAGEYETADQFISRYSPAMLFPVIPSLLIVLANIIFFVSLFYYADERVRPLALAGLIFGTAYAVCAGTNYFIQLTVVPQNIRLEQVSSVASFSMHVRGSFTYALDNLGYIFLSFSFLLFSGIFDLKGLQGYIKTAFIVYGITGLLGATGYLAGNSFLESFVFISVFPYLIAIVLMLIQYFRLEDKTV